MDLCLHERCLFMHALVAAGSEVGLIAGVGKKED